jgi:hypothetical protein
MKKFLFTLLAILISHAAFSQGHKTPGPVTTQVTSSSLPDAEILEVVTNLKLARESGDVQASRLWQSRLQELTSPQIIYPQTEDFNIIRGGNETPHSGESQITRVSNGIIVANAISKERINGDIYAALGVYGSLTAPDTLRILRSTNNGITFSVVTSITSGDLKFEYNGLDIEAVSKGDSSFAFVAMTYTIGGFKSVSFVRARQDGNQVAVLSAAGSSVNRYTNARLTSDNGVYSTTTYLYLSLTLDSLAGGRNLKSKVYYVPNIFDNSISAVSGYQSAAGGQYGYYVAGIAPDTAKFETDIAFLNTEGNVDQLYTVTIVRGIPGLFGSGSTVNFTRSTTYGTTAPTLFNVTDPGFIKESPRFATNGYRNNTAMVVVRRLYGGGDWDPYWFYTADISSASPLFNPDFVDERTDTTTGVSVTGRTRSNGTYLFAFNNREGENNSKVYIRPYNYIGIGFMSLANHVPGTNYYGYADAGFRNINSDSCLVIWAGSAGINSYVTGGCVGPGFTGIGNSSSAADGFNLSQNYPNPFNPNTVISYQIPKEGFVSIKVFDILGKEVAEIVNGAQSMGLHTVEFNAANFSSGVYYYRMETGDFTDTRKMLLVK